MHYTQGAEMNFTLIRRLSFIRHSMKIHPAGIVIVLVLTLLSSSIVLADPYDLNITQWQLDQRDEQAGLFYDYLALSYYLDTTSDTFIYGVGVRHGVAVAVCPANAV